MAGAEGEAAFSLLLPEGRRGTVSTQRGSLCRPEMCCFPDQATGGRVEAPFNNALNPLQCCWWGLLPSHCWDEIRGCSYSLLSAGHRLESTRVESLQFPCSSGNGNPSWVSLSWKGSGWCNPMSGAGLQSVRVKFQSIPPPGIAQNSSLRAVSYKITEQQRGHSRVVKSTLLC